MIYGYIAAFCFLGSVIAKTPNPTPTILFCTALICFCISSKNNQ